MFEVLLTLCLAGDPGACRTGRHPGGETRGACLAEADRLRRAAPDQPQDWPCVPAGTTPDFPVTEIAPGVFVHKGVHAEADPGNRGGIANLGFVIGGEAVAVIDPGGSATVARALLAAIRTRTELPVRWAILTHMHPDHALGASVFAEAGAALIGHGKLPRALAARSTTYLEANARLIGPVFEGTVAPGPIDKVRSTRALDLGGRVLILEAHPTAHTDNDLTVFDRLTGTWFLGDLLFMGHLPALDGSITGWIALSRELRERTATRAVPGHGPVSAPWPAASDAMLAYLELLARDTRAAIAAGLPMLRATGRIGRSAADAWLLHEIFNPRNATAAFKELEWE